MPKFDKLIVMKLETSKAPINIMNVMTLSYRIKFEIFSVQLYIYFVIFIFFYEYAFNAYVVTPSPDMISCMIVS